MALLYSKCAMSAEAKVFILKCEGSSRNLKTPEGWKNVPCKYQVTYRNYPNLLADAKRVGGFDCAWCNRKTLRIFQKKVKSDAVAQL